MLELLSYYRDAELHGAGLLLRLMRLLDDDADAQVKLTLHVAQETQHAWLWTKRMTDMGGAPVRIAAGYQSRIGLRLRPRTLVDLLALTIVVESRSLARYREHAARPGVDDATLAVLYAITADETGTAWPRQARASDHGRSRGRRTRSDRDRALSSRRGRGSPSSVAHEREVRRATCRASASRCASSARTTAHRPHRGRDRARRGARVRPRTWSRGLTQLAFDEIIDTMAGRVSLEVGAGDGGFLPEELATEIGRVAGVELAVPVVRGTAFHVGVDGTSEAMTVQGVDA